MEAALLSILKIILLVSLSFASGIAARIWQELKIVLVFMSGFILLFLLLYSALSADVTELQQDIKNIVTFSIIFITLGYLSGPVIIEYFDLRLEKYLSSNAFDSTYRKYSKNKRKTFDAADFDAFYEQFQTQYTRSKASSSTAYEDYSRFRRAQSQAEHSAPPPQQNTQSEKEKMFDILEVSARNADGKALKSAYRKLAWKYHPDVLAKDDLSDAQLKKAEARMQDINRAYDWLKENGFAE